MDEGLRSVFARYKGERSDLVPLLQEVQSVLGYLPREAMAEVAGFLKVPESAVYGVVSFYTQFHTTRQGKHNVKVCQGTACHVRGARRVMEAVRKKLGIRPGQTSEDYRFTLERVACFGSCALSPVMVINGKVYGRMTPQKAEALLERLK